MQPLERSVASTPVAHVPVGIFGTVNHGLVIDEADVARRVATVGAHELFGGDPRHRSLIRSTQVKRELPERRAARVVRAGSLDIWAPRLGSEVAEFAECPIMALGVWLDRGAGRS